MGSLFFFFSFFSLFPPPLFFFFFFVVFFFFLSCVLLLFFLLFSFWLWGGGVWARGNTQFLLKIKARGALGEDFLFFADFWFLGGEDSFYPAMMPAHFVFGDRGGVWPAPRWADSHRVWPSWSVATQRGRLCFQLWRL